jgi:hypothetical protein
VNKEEVKKEIGTRRDVIKKLDKAGMAVASAFVHGLEIGKAIYKPAKPAEDKREQAV